jgi:branched-chain amino acid transport system ATP-binding protein
MPTLEVNQLTVRYGGIQALRSLDIAVGPGEIVVLLGVNGAGKSSCLRAIAGLVPSTGTVRLDGRDISNWKPHRVSRAGIALIPEGRRVFVPLSVRDNLLMGAYASRSGASRKADLEHVYELFPVLRERQHTAAGWLSGGEQQMLAFGRALMARPAIMLMDEPSMGLAPVMVDQVMAAITAMSRQGIGILLVEQNAFASLAIGTRATVLERGRATLTGTAADLAADPTVMASFVGLRGLTRSTGAGSTVDGTNDAAGSA